MNIGVDAREIQNGVITGIGRSLINYIHYFEKYDKTNNLILFSTKKIPLIFNDRVKVVAIEECRNIFWDQYKLPLAIKRNQIDLFYSTYYKVPLFTNVKVVSQVLDLMYLTFKPYRDSLGFVKRVYWNLLGGIFSKKARIIITDSEHAKSDIIKQWNIEKDKIIVIPLGISERYHEVKDFDLLKKVQDRFKLSERYILYLGNFKIHKNVESLIYAFSNLHDKYKDYYLVLAGPIDSNGKRIVDLVNSLKLEKSVIFTGTITENDHPEAILTMASCFVFPSLYEGFGLPPLEAMACNVPVIASNLTSVPEVVGDAAITVDPLNIMELTKAIEDLIVNEKMKEYYREMGLNRVKLFTEEESGRRIYEALMKVMEEKE